MNLEKSTLKLLERLNIESIRPIFWQNRKYSYISRTSGWDEFSNGRWGDSRSPAFGDIDLSASQMLRQSPKRAYELCCCPQLFRTWPTSLSDTEVLKKSLIRLNKTHFFKLKSQPALSAVRSSDKVYGWRPKNGLLYQKQTPDAAVTNGVITYYIVDKAGNLSSNTKDDDINAVTWGVFRGEEILQPTIVEVSFLAWKDDMYHLEDWISIYKSKVIQELVPQEQLEIVYNLLTSFADYVLCNLVNNDFTNNNSVMFQLLESVSA
ncbi:hypothetical protein METBISCDRAFT_31768 [Metschnikowia bicuspidata]|uniref:MTHFR SAM-binding regulatory domain-containing protein n=1 Tax=Metschnikowia bicuspidata TaxID=27322 RepID=A0A4P9Z9M7_9ASCO|nr:hypothetical protein METBISCDRAFT_31768 [Metschnikowia bicuspidata]